MRTVQHISAFFTTDHNSTKGLREYDEKHKESMSISPSIKSGEKVYTSPTEKSTTISVAMITSGFNSLNVSKFGLQKSIVATEGGQTPKCSKTEASTHHAVDRAPLSSMLPKIYSVTSLQ